MLSLAFLSVGEDCTLLLSRSNVPCPLLVTTAGGGGCGGGAPLAVVDNVFSVCCPPAVCACLGQVMDVVILD